MATNNIDSAELNLTPFEEQVMEELLLQYPLMGDQNLKLLADYCEDNGRYVDAEFWRWMATKYRWPMFGKYKNKYEWWSDLTRRSSLNDFSNIPETLLLNLDAFDDTSIHRLVGSINDLIGWSAKYDSFVHALYDLKQSWNKLTEDQRKDLEGWEDRSKVY